MDSLFDYVGVELPQHNIIVSDVVLKSIAEEASKKADFHSNSTAKNIYDDVLFALRKFFNPEDITSMSEPSIKQASVVAISNYLCLQDALECRSMKEIHALASGLYDSVISHIALIVKTTTLKEVECNVYPYVTRPWNPSDNLLDKLQAAD